MSSGSREGSPDSPDWLRSFKAPTVSSLASLSSPSRSSQDDNPYKDSETISSVPVNDDSDTECLSQYMSKKNSKTKVVTTQVSIEQAFSRKKKGDDCIDLEGKQNGNKVDGEGISSKQKDAQGRDDFVLLLSSDSEPSSSVPPPAAKKALKKKSPKKKPNRGQQPPEKENGEEEEPLKTEDTDAIVVEEVTTEKNTDVVIEAKVGEPAAKKASKKKSPKKKPDSGEQPAKKEDSEEEPLKTEDKDTDDIIAEEVTTDKNIKSSSGSSSRLPLVLSEKVNRAKVLVECEGDSIDLSGDMGAVGRVVISDSTEDVYLDLKGTIYKSTIVPSRTFCIVNVGQSEAKIEAIMNDFIQLTPQSNVYEAETMMEGTLEGYSFDSDDDANKTAKTAPKPTDQSGGTEEETDTKAKAKAKGENVSGKKRGRPTKEKQQPAKKARNSGPKKPKSKK